MFILFPDFLKRAPKTSVTTSNKLDIHQLYGKYDLDSDHDFQTFFGKTE